jgi:hypothetical protein
LFRGNDCGQPAVSFADAGKRAIATGGEQMNTQSKPAAPKDVGHPPEKPKKQLDREHDKALEDSFPASDPPATSQPTGTEPAGDPKVKP